MSYQIRASLSGPGIVGHQSQAIVLLQAGKPEKIPSQVLRERYGLTGRELQVLGLVASGYSNREIAGELGVTIHTARRHLEHIFDKLGVRSRAAVGARLREP